MAIVEIPHLFENLGLLHKKLDLVIAEQKSQAHRLSSFEERIKRLESNENEVFRITQEGFRGVRDHLGSIGALFLRVAAKLGVKE